MSATISAEVLEELKFLRKHSLSSIKVLALLAKTDEASMLERLQRLQRAGHAICVPKQGSMQWSISPASRSKFLPSEEELHREREAQEKQRRVEQQERRAQREEVNRRVVDCFYEVYTPETPVSAQTLATRLNLSVAQVTAILYAHSHLFEPVHVYQVGRVWYLRAPLTASAAAGVQ